MSTSTSQGENSAHQAWVLAVVAGFSDTVGFLTWGAFAGLMSGNSVLLGIALAAGQMGDALHRFGIIAAFLSGIAVATILTRKAIPLPGLVAIEATILLLAGVLPVEVSAPMLGLAMGIQNAMATQFGGLTLNTVFITGDLQKLIQTVAGRIGRSPKTKTPSDHAGTIIGLWLFYLLGAALGAVAHAHFAHPLLFAPLMLLIVLVRLPKFTAR
ncbi:MAG: YoaK family protein [Terrimicrobiaceae bacterium]